MSPLKESFNSWRNYVNEDLLVESRYKDALAYAQNFNKMGKQFKVKDVVDLTLDISKKDSESKTIPNYICF